ncbi:hypothetical protein PR048_026769 [Dryococelus australis]|uniref:Integrase catalytic domain-containing protein n=1 Tax=Dryococelus australis TaxID=614101 RepID=A0ABQ9GM91_9NEOP|nr:hypothetical protein PR048_026769 [Dryococelus australis]
MHGLPQCVVSDNGTSFTSEEFTMLLRRNGIQHMRTPPYHSASNDMVGRGVQMAKNAPRWISGQNENHRQSCLLEDVCEQYLIICIPTIRYANCSKCHLSGSFTQSNQCGNKD